MNTVAVIGGSGFLGSYVADELSDRGFKVIVADLRPSAFLRPEQTFVRCDILDEASLDELFKMGLEFVYNFAGLADINDAIYLPKKTMELNIVGNLNILEKCIEYKIKRFVYASSAYAYSSVGSFYGISKYSSEKIVREYQTRFGLDYTIVRYGSLYGERADQHNGVYRILKQALDEGKITFKGTGEELREYIHAKDAAKLSVDILEEEKFSCECILLTGVERLTQKQLLTMVREILGGNLEIKFDNKQYKGHYKVTPYSFQPDVAKKLTANPFIDIGQGLVSCLNELFYTLKENEV